MTEDNSPTKKEMEQVEQKEGYNLKIRRKIDNIKEEYKRLVLCLILLLVFIYAMYLLFSSIYHISGADPGTLNESINDVYNNIPK